MVSTASIAAAIGSIPEKKERLRKSFEELQSLSSTLSSFTFQWKDLDEHFSSIEKSIQLRFQELQSKETSLPKSAPYSDASTPKPKDGDAEPRSELKELCLKMNGNGLRAFINENRKDLANLRNEIAPAIQLAPDPAKLVLDAMEGFYPKAPRAGSAKDAELHALRRTCILLLERLHAIKPDIRPETKESAKKVALKWNAKMPASGDSAVEGWAFLQFLATFNLASEFDVNEIMDIIIPIARRKPTIDVCKVLGISDKIPDLIEKLNSKGKHLEAVKFVYAFDLAEKFPPVPLLKAFLEESKKAVNELLKKGNNSTQTRNEANAKEISALKAVIKAIEEYKLESEFSPGSLEKQVATLEKRKVEKKRVTPTSSNAASKTQQLYSQKRVRLNTGSAAAIAAYPSALVPQNQSQLGLADRGPYLSSAGSYGLVGTLYDRGGSSLLGPSMVPGKGRSPPSSYLYSSEAHVGSGLYGRSTAYDGRPAAYDSALPTYDGRAAAYDRSVAFDNRAAAYENRPVAYGGYPLQANLPPQYNPSQLS